MARKSIVRAATCSALVRPDDDIGNLG